MPPEPEPAATAETSISAPALPPTLRLGTTHLIVTDLARSVDFYRSAVGLDVHRQDAGSAALGVDDEDLLVLHAHPAARPAGRHAGLFHVALLFPTREELAHVARRLIATRTPITGASDHGVSEALYLNDPDGNGLELYWDRPRAAWPPPSTPDATVGMYTIALDAEGLLGLVADQPDRPAAGPGLVVGHLHLHVGDLEAAARFYRDVLGFAVTVSIGGATFFGAGGYHHHLGANVWRGTGIPAQPATGTVGLGHWTIVLETPEQVDAVRGRIEAADFLVEEHPDGFLVVDPFGVAVAVRAGAAPRAQ